VAGFSVGSVLLALSSVSEHGLHFVLAALMPMALAQAAFLPTATEAVIEETPPGHRGLAMALFSQCFAISAMAAPLIGGALLDRQGHGLLLWLLTAAACLLMLPVVRSIQPRFTDSSGALEETVDGVTGNPGLLGD
jgi:MFS family permease